jgi:hypothetical protein
MDAASFRRTQSPDPPFLYYFTWARATLTASRISSDTCRRALGTFPIRFDQEPLASIRWERRLQRTPGVRLSADGLRQAQSLEPEFDHDWILGEQGPSLISEPRRWGRR